MLLESRIFTAEKNIDRKKNNNMYSQVLKNTSLDRICFARVYE